MLRVLKSTGRVSSSANDKVTTNSRGRVELALGRNPEGESYFTFRELGNYGKVRWNTTVRLTTEEVEAMVKSGQEYLAGTTQCTLEDQPEAVQTRDVEVTPEDKATFELVNGNR